MKTRILLWGLAGLVGLTVAAPFGTAQTEPARVVFTAEFAHPSMPLPEGGRADMPVIVRGMIAGTTCAQAPTYTVTVKLDTFAKWAGASMEPFSVKFQGPSPGPGPLATASMGEQETSLNFAWDVESAPKKGAKQDYYVIISGPEVQAENEVCQPPTSKQGGKFGPMTATLPDKPDAANATGPADCAADPFQAACQGLQTSEPANSPAFDAALLVAAVLGLGYVLRRRQ